jgi:hypothetical protein
MRFANRDDSAWNMGDLAYEAGDTLEMGVIKAEHAGYRPGCNGYSAFITAFGRRVRSGQAVAPAAVPAQLNGALQPAAQ